MKQTAGTMSKADNANIEVNKTKTGSLKEIVEDELVRVGNGGPWVW